MTNPKVKDVNDVKSDQIAYIKWLAEYAKDKGMAFGLKNSNDLLNYDKDVSAFGISESCYKPDPYNNKNEDWCGNYTGFTNFGKAVFSLIYKHKVQDQKDICTNGRKHKLATQYCTAKKYGNDCSGGCTHCSANDL